MALIPNTFEAGTVAASSDVNENFQAIADAVGDASTASRLSPPGDVVVGPRANVQISAEGDTAAGLSTSYVQIGWNAELYSDGSWKVRRFASGEPATAIRVGTDGFEVWTTSRDSGSLNSQFTRVFQIKATTGNDYVYVRPSLTRVAEAPDELEDYRLTLVLFNTPQEVYENVTIYAGTKTRRASDYNVPTSAHAVLLAFEGVAASSDARNLLTQARSTRSQAYGFIVAAASGEQGAGQGVVPLGTSGDYDGKFVEDRSAQWTSASLYVQGYYI